MSNSHDAEKNVHHLRSEVGREGGESGASTQTEAFKKLPVLRRIANQKSGQKSPICVLIVGMAGSGKTSLMGQLQQSSMDPRRNRSEEVQVGNEQEPNDPMPAYCLNLDPATVHLPYNVSIDIRDTVDYKASCIYHRSERVSADDTIRSLITTPVHVKF